VVNGVYTQTYNRRHHKVGLLFQGRFKAILVDRDAYFYFVRFNALISQGNGL